MPITLNFRQNTQILKNIYKLPKVTQEEIDNVESPKIIIKAWNW